jgi:EmrB/QacA subfamily drug resistance transporter
MQELLPQEFSHFSSGVLGMEADSKPPSVAPASAVDAKATEKLSRRSVVLIIAGLMTGLLLGAMDQTIVATAGPTIIADLGGLSLYAWVFSAYILTQTVAMPIFGKLSDLYGRKRFFFIGLLIFMVGSILSGASQNIYELIIFRGIQGLGGGAFFPIALSVIGVTFPPELRGRVFGAFSAVFGIASVVGPQAGSYLVEAINWRWIFYINLPLGIISIILLSVALKETKQVGYRPVVDWLGIPTLAAWIGLLNLGFLSGGSTYPWYSWEEALFFGGAAAFFVAFILVEMRAKEPVLPLSLIKGRNISSASAVSFLRGLMLLAVVSYIPLYIQAGLGLSIDTSRNILDAFLLPMVGASFVGGLLSTKASYRNLSVVSLVIAVIGAYLLTFLNASSSAFQVSFAVAVLGAGIGCSFSPVGLAIINSAKRAQMGVASSLAQFMGNLGGTIGIAMMGALQVNTFASKLNGVLHTIPAQFQSQAAQFLGNANLVGQILSSPATLAQLTVQFPGLALLVPALRVAFVQSVTPLFTVGLVVGVASVLAALPLKGSAKEQVAAMKTEVPSKKELKETPVAPA